MDSMEDIVFASGNRSVWKPWMDTVAEALSLGVTAVHTAWGKYAVNHYLPQGKMLRMRYVFMYGTAIECNAV